MDFALAEFHDGSVRIEYRETAAGELKNISFPIHRISRQAIYAGPGDVGIRWLLSAEEDGTVLHLEVPSEQYGQSELRLIRRQ